MGVFRRLKRKKETAGPATANPVVKHAEAPMMDLGGGVSARAVMCRKCAAPNEPPFIFCNECGAPRVKLGHYQVLGNLSLTMMAFMGTYYFAEMVEWPWPIYLLYSLLFFQFTLFLVMGSEARLLRVAIWVAAFLAGFGTVYHYINVDGPLLFLLMLQQIPEMAKDDPNVFYTTVGGISAAILIPLYFRWRKLYGWVNAYRILILVFFFLTLAAILGLWGVKLIHDRAWLPDLQSELVKFVEKTKPKYDHVLNLVAVTLGRIFVFEIFVFAAVRGYRMARRDKPAVAAGQLAGESGFSRSLLRIAMLVRQFGHALENMVTYLWETALVLAKDVWMVFKAFCREMLFPTIALVGCALLLYYLTKLTVVYIDSNTAGDVVKIFAVLVGILTCEMVFLICKTHYRPVRIFEFHMQLLGWLLPNMIVFFLLISLSLWASTEALKSGAGDTRTLPFAIGLLTKFFGFVLALLVAVILYRKRSLFALKPVDAAPHVAVEAAPAVAAAVAEEPAAEVAAAEAIEVDPELGGLEAAAAGVVTPPASKTHGALEKVAAIGGKIFFRRGRKAWDLGGATPAKTEPGGAARIVSAARGAVARTQLGESARKAVGNLTDRMQGRPEIVQRLIEAKQRYAEKYYQYDALEKTKDTISEELYLTLRNTYLDDLNRLLLERDQTQSELDRLHGMQLVEKNMLDMKVTTLRAKVDELEHLHKVGALNEKDFKKRVEPLNNELRLELARLEACQQKIGFMAPEATPMRAEEG